MNKPEQQFWVMLNQKNRMPGDTSRVENVCDPGCPDVSGTWGVDYWAELKVCHNKNKDRAPELLMQDTQPVWHFRRSKLGCLIFVMVRYHDKIMIYKALPEFKKYDLLGVLTKEKNKFDWGWFTEKLKFEISYHNHNTIKIWNKEKEVV